MEIQLVERVWTRQYINDLPDGAFALILPGGEKDEQGKTVPRNLRKFPHHNRNGAIDLPHLRNANARVPQSDLTDDQKRKALAHLDRHKEAAGIGQTGKEAVEPLEFEIAEEPTMDELIQAIEDIIEEINARFDALTEAKTKGERGHFEGAIWVPEK